MEFRLNAYGTDDLKVFQVWLGHNGVQDITFNYDTDHHNLDGVLLTADDGGLTVGAENEGGTGGDQLDETAEQDTLPPVDLAVVSTDPSRATRSRCPSAVGELVGTGVLHAELTSPRWPASRSPRPKCRCWQDHEVSAFVHGRTTTSWVATPPSRNWPRAPSR